MTRILRSCITVCLMLALTISSSSSQDVRLTKLETVRNDTKIDYTKIIKFWEDHKNDFVVQGDVNEVVLVMGNTGAGKTTLILALVGKKLKIIKKMGYFMIVDDEGKIGTNSSSKTLVPEIMVDSKRNVTYIDCSGFRDNRDIEYEISSLYFQNILMDKVEKIKLVLIVNYNSVVYNGNKNDLDDLLEHVSEFMKNVSKFNDSVALAVSKVDNIYEELDNGTSIPVDDQTILDGIADYLEDKKKVYQDKTENLEKNRRIANLIHVLLEKKNGTYQRIGLFHKPTSVGLLEEKPKLMKDINNIAGIITNNLQYTRKQKDDFGFALSESSKYIVDQIVNDIYAIALTNHLLEVQNATFMYFTQIEKGSRDIKVLRTHILRVYDFFSQTKNANKPEILFEMYLNITHILNITLPPNTSSIISKELEKLNFFTTVWNNNADIHMMELKDKNQIFMNSIENFKNFYDFLNNLQNRLDAYNSQKFKNYPSINNIIEACRNSSHKVVQDIPDLEDIIKAIGSYEFYQKIRTLQLNQFQLKSLEAIFTVFKREGEFSWDNDVKEMIVRGYNVRISDVVGKNNWAQADRILIFALNKVFIDQTIDETGKEKYLSIWAPTWEVAGGPKIILDGKAGESYKKASAESSTSNATDGSDGLPGLPGGLAGNFTGVGQEFINLEYLEIHANGGMGGPGQHGGNGIDGVAGEELTELYFKRHVSINQMMEDLTNDGYRYSAVRITDPNWLKDPSDIEYMHFAHYFFYVWTKSVTLPSNGGNGGVGGEGGFPGRIIMSSLGQPIHPKTSNSLGSTGLSGRGGRGGEKISYRPGVKFLFTTGTLWFASGIKSKYRDIEWSSTTTDPAGKDGKSGTNTRDKKSALRFAVRDTSGIKPPIDNFKEFIRANLFENIKESELKAFIDKLENNNQIE